MPIFIDRGAPLRYKTGNAETRRFCARDGDERAQGQPIALVDWETAGPVNRLTELAMAAWNNAQLYDDDVAAMNGLPDAAPRIRQVQIFTEAYELPAADRHQLAYRVIEFAAQSAANEVIEQQITPQTKRAPRVWGIAWQTRSLAWLIRNRPALEAALA